jgi:hypothetical protein
MPGNKKCIFVEKEIKMKKILVIVSICLLAACTVYKPIVPSQGDADRAAQKFPGTTLADLNQGEAIFEKSCKKCHSLKKPFRKSEEEIRSVLPKMAKRAKIDDKQQDLVLKYLLTMNSVQQAK